MPTGYTATLNEGEQDFNDFVLECARAFGALILMRDDPAGTPIPDEFKPSDYSKRALQEARERFAEVEAWTDEEVSAAAQASYDEALASWQKYENKKVAIEVRYRAMVERVEAWEPPTEHHEGLKKFMLEQLHQSIEFDCGYHSAPPEPMTGRAYRAQELERLAQSIENNAKRYEEEVERAKERTEWVRDLRRSLGIDTVERSGV